MDAPNDGERSRCDFCQSPIPTEPVVLVHEGTRYRFCCRACRDAMRDAERVFTTYRGYRWVDAGVAALDATLPQGLLRNSFVLLSAHPGTRVAELGAELVWRTLRRDEPAVVVTFHEPPVSVVGRLLDLGWNVLPALEVGDLHFLDCFTHRVEDRERMVDRMNDWNTHLHSVAEPEITTVREPTNTQEIESRLDDCLSAKGMVDRGCVVIDSLTEFGSLVQPIEAYDVVKDLRADVCKGRFVPIYAGAAYTGDADRFPHDLEYMFDGIVDMELNTELVPDALIKRIRIRKMSGVLVYPEWTAYEFASDDGLVAFDPREEMQDENAGDDTLDDADA